MSVLVVVVTGRWKCGKAKSRRSRSSKVLAYSISRIGLSKKSFVRFGLIYIMISYGRYSVSETDKLADAIIKRVYRYKRDKILDVTLPASLLCYYGDEF